MVENFSQPYILSTEICFFKSRTLLVLYTAAAETQPQPSLQRGVISLLVIYIIWELLICVHGFKNTTDKQTWLVVIHLQTAKLRNKPTKPQGTAPSLGVSLTLPLHQKARRALPLAPSSCLLGRYFSIHLFPSWLSSHPLNMYLKHEELKRGDVSSNGSRG